MISPIPLPPSPPPAESVTVVTPQGDYRMTTLPNGTVIVVPLMVPPAPPVPWVPHTVPIPFSEEVPK